MKAGIIDYGAGNLRSVANAVQALGKEAIVLPTPEGMDRASHLILPGVGSFGDCMAELSERGFIGPIREWIEAGKPYFGICLGYHALFEGSEESPGVEGLGVFKGHVRRFSDKGLKIPHMGWNLALPRNAGDPMWNGLGETPYFYFVHSYYPEPADPELVAMTTEYGDTFASAIRSGAVVATQFHPEKSQQTGLRLLGNFLS